MEFPTSLCIYKTFWLLDQMKTLNWKHWKKSLKRLAATGLNLKRDKCIFMAQSTVYLGHKFDAEGLHPLPEKDLSRETSLN